MRDIFKNEIDQTNDELTLLESRIADLRLKKERFDAIPKESSTRPPRFNIGAWVDINYATHTKHAVVVDVQQRNTRVCLDDMWCEGELKTLMWWYELKYTSSMGVTLTAWERESILSIT